MTIKFTSDQQVMIDSAAFLRGLSPQDRTPETIAATLVMLALDEIERHRASKLPSPELRRINPIPFQDPEE